MSLVWILVIAFLGFVTGGFVINRLFRFLIRKKNSLHLHFLKSACKFLWALFFVIIVTNLFPSTQYLSRYLLTSSGLFVAVAGFAAQQVLADMLGGIVLSWSKPFDVGEKITIQDLNISGIVENITLRHTVIRTYHNSRLIVPNAVLNKSVIENSNYDNHYIGYYMEIPISYDSDTEKAIAIMQEVVEKNELVLDVREDRSVGQKATVTVKDFTRDGIVLKCTVCTHDLDDSFIACSNIRREIKKRFDEENIAIFDRTLNVRADGHPEESRFEGELSGIGCTK